MYGCCCSHLGIQDPRLFGLALRSPAEALGNGDRPRHEYRFLDHSHKLAKYALKSWRMLAGWVGLICFTLFHNAPEVGPLTEMSMIVVIYRLIPSIKPGKNAINNIRYCWINTAAYSISVYYLITSYDVER